MASGFLFRAESPTLKTQSANSTRSHRPRAIRVARSQPLVSGNEGARDGDHACFDAAVLMPPDDNADATLVRHAGRYEYAPAHRAGFRSVA